MPSGTSPAASGLGDGLALGVSRLLQVALAVVAQKAIQSSLSETDIGRWFTFQLIANLAIATLSWPMSSVVRLGAEEWHESRRLGRTFALHGQLLVGSFLLLSAVAVVAHGAVARYVDVGDATTLVLAWAFVTASALVVGAHLKPAQRLKRFALLPLVTRVFWAGSLGFAVFVEHRTLGTRDVVLVGLAAALPQLAVALALVARSVRPLARPKPGDARRAVGFGLPVCARQLGMQAFAYVNFALVLPYLGVAQAGRFQVAATVAEQAALFASALEDLMGPILARAAHKGQEGTLQVYYRTLAPQVVLVWSTIAGAGLLLARPVLAALSAKAVEATAPALEVLLVATAVRVLVSLETPVLDAHLISGPSLGFYALGFATNVGLDLALIPRFGVEGAAWGSLAGWLVNSIARSVYCRARFGVNALRLYAWLWPAVAALAWTRLASNAPFPLVTWEPARPFVAAATLVVVSLAAGRLLGVFAPETLGALESVNMPARLRRLLERFYGGKP